MSYQRRLVIATRLNQEEASQCGAVRLAYR
jgi:hypothetical protein